MYDPACSTYWCDKCGAEMAVDGPASTDDTLVLKCARARILPGRREDLSCGFTRTFVAAVDSPNTTQIRDMGVVNGLPPGERGLED